MFYYGSFVELLEDERDDSWETEIMDTILHELQHHLVSRAGRDDLARQEIEELARALQVGIVYEIKPDPIPPPVVCCEVMLMLS